MNSSNSIVGRLGALFVTIMLCLSLNTGAAAQSTVASVTSASASGSSFQRKTFIDTKTSVQWAFYYESGGASPGISYASSTDGVTWTNRGDLFFGNSDFAVTYKTIANVSYVFVTFIDVLDNISIQRGVLSSTSIAFESPTVIFSAGSGIIYRTPVASISADDTLWVGMVAVDSAQYEGSQVKVVSFSPTALSLTPQSTALLQKKMRLIHGLSLVPQLGSAMLAIINGDAGNIQAYKFNGSSWNLANTGGDFAWFGFGGTSLAGTVKAVAFDPTNPTQLYVGGTFRAAGGVSNANLIARWDGTNWNSLGTGIDGTEVTALEIKNTTLYVGGLFDSAGGISNTTNIAKWDTSSLQWSALGLGVNTQVYALESISTDLFVGGNFTSAGGVTGADKIAKWDGSTWSAVAGASPDGAVKALAAMGSDLFVGGAFTTLGAGATFAFSFQTPHYAAKFDGINWDVLSTNDSALDGEVDAIVPVSDGIAFGGQFLTVESSSNTPFLAHWSGTWSTNHYGTAPINAPVHALAFDTNSGKLYVGGEFSNAGGIGTADHIGIYDGSFWSSPANEGTEGDILALSLDETNHKLYIGGDYSSLSTASSIIDSSAGPISQFDTSGVTWLGLGQAGAINNDIRAIGFYKGELYVGGSFTNAGGVDGASRLARWDGSTWNKVGGISDNLDAAVTSILVTDENTGILVIGGLFTNFSSQAASFIASWDGTSWSKFGSIQLNAGIEALVLYGSDIIALGAFTTASGVSGADYIARWNGSAWTNVGTPATFNASTDFHAAAAIGSTLYVGGSFSSVGNNIASFDGTNWSALSSGTDGPVNSLVAQGTDIFVGGAFTVAGGNASAVNIARWNGSSWFALSAGLNNTVTAVTSDGSNVIAAGYFINAGGDSSADYIASWNGSSWSALNSGLNGPSYALLSRSGTLYAGGDFSLASSSFANYFALRTKAAAISSSDLSEISATSDSTTADVHLLYSFADHGLVYRRFAESNTSWGTVVALSSSVGPIMSPALSINQSNGKLIAGFIDTGLVKTHQGKSPYDSGSWSTTSTTVDSAVTNLGLISNEVLTNNKASLYWIKGSGAPFSFVTQAVSTVSMLSGTVTASGSPLSGVTISAGTLGNATTDTSGNYSFNSVTDGSSNTVTPSKSGYTFSPTSASPSITADTTQNFTATLAAVTISGQVTIGGSALAGVAVTVTNTSGGATLGTATTNAQGNYSVSGIAAGTNYTVTPVLNGYTFTPPSTSGTASADATVSFTAALTQYKLSGSVTTTFRPVPNVTVNAVINGQAQTTTTNRKGIYTFTGLTIGMTYSVTPVLTGHTITPTSKSGVISGDTVDLFSDALDTHTLSGTVVVDGKGLAGVTIHSGVFGDQTTDANGAFSFGALDYGSPYFLVPELKGYTFSPENATGSLTSDAALTFTATANTFSITGKVTNKGKPLANVLIDAGTLGKKTTGNDGSFKFTKIAAGSDFAITPTLKGYSFSPPRAAGTVMTDLKVNFKTQAGTVFGSEVERVSVSSDGDQGDADSGDAELSAIAMSSDGQLVAFSSTATTMVDDDTNGASDVFLKDRASGLTTIISVNSSGEYGDSASGTPTSDARAVSLAADGSAVAFHSQASNLVLFDTNSASDVFLYDVAKGTQTLISATTSGTSGDDDSISPSVSDAGKYVAFSSEATDLITTDTNAVSDIFRRDVAGASSARVSVSSSGAEANGESFYPSISSDGDQIVFVSSASNLVDGDTNNADDIFLRSVAANSTTRISVGAGGAEVNGDSSLPSISADGKVIAFASVATNLVSGDTNGQRDIFVYDSTAGTVERVSLSSNGEQADGPSGFGEIGLSTDGRFIVFSSEASNLVEKDTNGVRDIFVHDRQKHLTGLVSRSAKGDLGGAASEGGVISGGGTRIAFTSAASNLLTDPDTNNKLDVFTRPVGPLPDVFKPNQVIANPPTIVATSKAVTVVMNSFQLGSTTGSSFDGFSLAENGEEFGNSSQPTTDAAGGQIRYVVTFTNTKDKLDRTRQNGLRNVLTVRSLSVGSYSVSYHTELIKKKKKVSRSKESPKQKFQIKK